MPSSQKTVFLSRLVLVVSLVLLSTIMLNSTARATMPPASPTPQPPLASRAPQSYYLPVTRRSVALPPADAASARLNVPPGFAVRIFAQNFTGIPRFMAFGPDGQLYVSLFGAGQIARLPDRNGDGLADGVEIVASGLSLPHGLEWRADWLYVAENDKVERLRDSNNGGVLNQRELITSNVPGIGGHATRTIHFGPDGLMYVSAGSICNVCVEPDPRRAALLRFNPDGSIPPSNPFAGDPDPLKQPVWSWGLRNTVDFTWTPGGALWANMNGRDGLGDALPAEAVAIAVQGGKSNGWPYCINTVVGLNSPLQPATLDASSGLTLPAGFDCSLSNVQPALFSVPAHSAPLGMEFATQSAFPIAYKKDLFVALHGSWNTTGVNIRDCQVERIVLQNGVPVSSETFVNGWRAPGLPCGDAATWGRPADVVFSPDGSMFISDDKGNRVYRLVYVGP